MSTFLFKTGIACFSLLAFSAASAQMFKGELEVLVSDNFKKNKSTVTYRLYDGNKRYELKIPKSLIKDNLLTGVSITVDGGLVSGLEHNTIKVESISVDKQRLEKQSAFPDKRSILTLLVDFNDKKATDWTSISGIDNQLYENKTSVKNNIKRSSFNQLQIIRDPNKDGKPGIYNISLNYDAENACNPDAWATDAVNAAAQAGINVESFKHYMLVLPEDINCPWGGLGHLGCGTHCNTWVVGESSLLMAHEFGHNLGMNHSSTDLNNNGNVDSEYGDLSCIMGNGYRQINAPHRDQMHWYDAYPDRTVTVTDSGEYYVKSADINKNALQVIKINRKDGNGTYYISYRTNAAPFGMGDAYRAKFHIHRTLPSSNRTLLVATLDKSGTFVDAANGVTITALATKLDSGGRVQITLN